jgi:hypothetical protein
MFIFWGATIEVVQTKIMPSSIVYTCLKPTYLKNLPLDVMSSPSRICTSNSKQKNSNNIVWILVKMIVKKKLECCGYVISNIKSRTWGKFRIGFGRLDAHS